LRKLIPPERIERDEKNVIYNSPFIFFVMLENNALFLAIYRFPKSKKAANSVKQIGCTSSIVCRFRNKPEQGHQAPAVLRLNRTTSMA
jgi:hypothetical protein